jgi:hypothetical protein
MRRSVSSSFEALRQQALLDAICGTEAKPPVSPSVEARTSARTQSGAPTPLRTPCDVPASAASLMTTARVEGSPARIASGIDAYRGNVDAAAERALAATFPTVAAMVGGSDFGGLARAYRRDDPPSDGDLGTWGAGFAAWLGRQPRLAEWPYLGDCAALDHAVHRCERAADALFDPASLALLESTDPARLHLLLRPGSAVLASPWPIVTIHATHRDPAADFATARAALAARRGEQALVVRSGWRAAVLAIDAPTAGFTRSLLDGLVLAGALDRAGTHFDFTAWLADALRGGWLQGVAGPTD